MPCTDKCVVCGALLGEARAWVGWAPGSVRCGGRRCAPTALWCSRLTSGPQTRPAGSNRRPRRGEPRTSQPLRSSAPQRPSPGAQPTQAGPTARRLRCKPGRHARSARAAHQPKGRGGAWRGDLGASRSAGRARLPLAFGKGWRGLSEPPSGASSAAPGPTEHRRAVLALGQDRHHWSPAKRHLAPTAPPQGTPQKQKPRLNQEPRFSTNRSPPGSQSHRTSSNPQR